MSTIAEMGQALRAQHTTSVQLVSAALEKAHDCQPELNTFITFMDDQALERARVLDEEVARGRIRSPLHGIPVAVKDNLLTAGIRTTNGTRIFADYVPDRSAAAVQQLEAAGAVIIGKTNLHELAYGITSNNPHYGAVRNPHDRARVPGGSSGGSGAAVAAGIVPVALGSDTGGSIRIPASFCGCFGLKPSYGLVDRTGCMPLGLTLDHVGPLAATVQDAALTMQALCRLEPERGASAAPLRIGWPENGYFDAVDPDVAAAIEEAVRALGATRIAVVVPELEALNSVARAILLGEAAAIYGRYLQATPELFGDDVRALLQQGTLLAATDYVNAQRARRQFIREFRALFSGIDVLVTPTTPNVAPLIGEDKVSIAGREEDVRLASTRLVRGINVLGFPAASLPCGMCPTGLPVGMQIIGPPGADAVVLRIAAAFERVIGNQPGTSA
ncbi:MAG TPA: amidase [Bryobacteraceae bacterium]|nr:amidase [Bryobacteraceae bacterium]